MKRLHALIPLLITTLLLSACSTLPAAPAVDMPTRAPTSAPTPYDLSNNPAAMAAAKVLAAQLGIPLGQISVESISAEQWPDSCLGLPNPGEMCAMHVVPGYRVVLMAGGNRYIFRTDLVGEEVRQEKPALQPSGQSTPTASALPETVVSANAERLKVTPGKEN